MMFLKFDDYEKKCLNDFIESVNACCLDNDYCGEKCPCYLGDCESAECLVTLIRDKLEEGGE